MKKTKNFKIIWHYLKDEKFKLFIYILLVICTYLPGLMSAYFWGKAIETLILKEFLQFVKYLALWNGLYILFYSILQVPREKVYNYLSIKFMKNVSKDLYLKIDNLPAVAFEEIGVGEFVNRLYNDTERVMDLLAKLTKLICKAMVVIIIVILSFSIF